MKLLLFGDESTKDISEVNVNKCEGYERNYYHQLVKLCTTDESTIGGVSSFIRSICLWQFTPDDPELVTPIQATELNLNEILDFGEKKDQLEAISQYGLVKEKTQNDSILKVMVSVSQPFLQAAITCMATIHPKLLYEELRYLDSVLPWIYPDNNSIMQKLLTTSDEEVFCRNIEKLGSGYSGSDDFDAMYEYILSHYQKQTNWKARRAAVIALANVSSHITQYTLGKLQSEQHPKVRMEVATLLSKTKELEVREELEHMMKDEDSGVRMRATCSYLTVVGYSDSAMKELWKDIQQEDREEELEIFLEMLKILISKNQGMERMQQILLKLLEDKHSSVQVKAAKLLSVLYTNTLT